MSGGSEVVFWRVLVRSFVYRIRVQVLGFGLQGNLKDPTSLTPKPEVHPLNVGFRGGNLEPKP